MAKAIVEGCVDFSKIRFWEACETAEVAWEETKDENGEVVQRVPYGNPLDPPREETVCFQMLRRLKHG